MVEENQNVKNVHILIILSRLLEALKDESYFKQHWVPSKCIVMTTVGLLCTQIYFYNEMVDINLIRWCFCIDDIPKKIHRIFSRQASYLTSSTSQAEDFLVQICKWEYDCC